MALQFPDGRPKERSPWRSELFDQAHNRRSSGIELQVQPSPLTKALRLQLDKFGVRLLDLLYLLHRDICSVDTGLNPICILIGYFCTFENVCYGTPAELPRLNGLPDERLAFALAELPY